MNVPYGHGITIKCVACLLTQDDEMHRQTTSDLTAGNVELPTHLDELYPEHRYIWDEGKQGN